MEDYEILRLLLKTFFFFFLHAYKTIFVKLKGFCKIRKLFLFSKIYKLQHTHISVLFPFARNFKYIYFSQQILLLDNNTLHCFTGNISNQLFYSIDGFFLISQ